MNTYSVKSAYDAASCISTKGNLLILECAKNISPFIVRNSVDIQGSLHLMVSLPTFPILGNQSRG